jgi:hypothetical protein
VDFAALKLAMERCRASSEGRSRQLDSMLEDRPWEDVAIFAAYDQQMENLHLKPWQVPPAHVNDPAHPEAGEGEAAALLRRMIAAGVSKWDPDPLNALDAAKKVT